MGNETMQRKVCLELRFNDKIDQSLFVRPSSIAIFTRAFS